MLAEDGRVALVVGSEVVYAGGREASAATMTPYDVAAVRLADGLELAGRPPADLDRYLDALRRDPSARATALTASGEMATAADAVGLVEILSGMRWAEAEIRTRAGGGLVGAYPGGQ
ncbi:MAG: hypothetical protein HYY42_01165 [Chloroflexi bacterium]|nr:hypothetical protein [Chloroflexota bacterium]